jgi:proteasome lid subunit RPN8/RPN11
MACGCDATLDLTVIVPIEQERVLYDVSMAAWRERKSEWGGLLFGRVYESRGRRVVWVAAAVPGVGSGTPVSFELDPLSYVVAQRQLRGRGLEEIGFWHSHPRLQVGASLTDVEYHRLAFPQTGSLSIIVDPFAPAGAAYANVDGDILPVPAYTYAGDGFGSAPAPRILRPWDPGEVSHGLS